MQDDMQQLKQQRVFGTRNRRRLWRRVLAVSVVATALSAVAAGPIVAASADKGVGPVKDVKLGPVDAALAQKGAQVFQQKCSACHKFHERYVGPPLRGVTTRRAPEWIMNMILNPQEMTQEDATAKELLGEYMMQMTFQNVTQEEARAILEHFRQNDAAGAGSAAEKK